MKTNDVDAKYPLYQFFNEETQKMEIRKNPNFKTLNHSSDNYVAEADRPIRGFAKIFRYFCENFLN